MSAVIEEKGKVIGGLMGGKELRAWLLENDTEVYEVKAVENAGHFFEGMMLFAILPALEKENISTNDKCAIQTIADGIMKNLRSTAAERALAEIINEIYPPERTR